MKIIPSGILAGLIILILSMIASYSFMLFPAVAADYKNTGLMRSWNDPIMSLFFFHPFILGIILAWAWDKTKAVFKGSILKRGMSFGLFVWLVGTVPGMWISYSSFPISLLTITSWTLGGLISVSVAGILFAKVNS